MVAAEEGMLMRWHPVQWGTQWRQGEVATDVVAGAVARPRRWRATGGTNAAADVVVMEEQHRLNESFFID